MTDTKYYSGKKLSRRKVSSGKYPFPYLSVDFHLKFCILKENAKNTTQGRSPYSRYVPISALCQNFQNEKYFQTSMAN